MSKRATILLLVFVALIVAGLAFDRHRANARQRIAAEKAVAEQTKNKVPPLPQRGALLAAADDAQVTGNAMCGFCYWREGGSRCNTVLQTAEEPGIVFLLPSEQRAEIEKLTGECAGGNYSITARGTMTQYGGHNYMLVKNFEAVKND
ncbi:MAG: hypothetical protein H0W20_16920 [Chthoniobacterales bacterium]|nr:hypothetical protein [Chthoniobacterales bacterium]